MITRVQYVQLHVSGFVLTLEIPENIRKFYMYYSAMNMMKTFQTTFRNQQHTDTHLLEFMLCISLYMSLDCLSTST